MKLSVIIVFACALQVSATVYSQSSIDINAQGQTLKEVLKMIEQKSDFRFFYSDNMSLINEPVTINATNKNVVDVLEDLFFESQLTFKIFENNLIVVAPKRSLQQQKVTGKVTDAATGEPIVGANILVEGTTIGVISDFDGKFSIDVPNAESTLLISFLGYNSERILAGSQTNLDIKLTQDITKLEEVVVVGYGTAKKSDVTGAMIRVGEKELKSRPVSNAIEAMQGKAAGVDITSNERPGELGAINIRGVRSLTASNSPLFVVDGIPIISLVFAIEKNTTPPGIEKISSSSGIETINPADIESIDILKDASATAIYGSKGANGVILVTTKRGKTGKLSLNYSSNIVIEDLHDRTKMMDAGEYITWRRWAYYYADPVNNPRGDQPTIEKDKVYFLGNNDKSAWKNIMKGWEGGTWDGSKVTTTGWTDMVTRTGVTQEHNLSASGGTEKMRAYGSFGYLDQKGTSKGQAYTRYTSKASVDMVPVKWFEMGASVNTTYSIQQFGMSTTGGQTSGPGSIYAAANGVFPYAVPYDSTGTRITYPGGDDLVKTIVDEWNYSENQRKVLRALGSLYAQINFLPGLRYRMNFGPDFRYYQNGVYIDAKSVSRVGSPNYVSLRNENNFSWTLDNLLYYDKKLGKHSVGITLLQTASASNYNFSYMRAIGIPLESQKWNALNQTNVTALDSWDSGLTENQLISYMARINYGFDDKYLLTFSGRWDGASQLAESHKWAFFPSIALAWRMDQEQWLKNIGWVNQMKLRLGFGTTGNSAINPYQTKGGVVSLFYPFGTTTTPGYVPSESLITGGNLPLANPELGWEKTTQYNIGVDFSLLKGRLSGVIDVYTSRTKDLLLQMTIPALTGYTNTFGNVGETKNKGVDITINSSNVILKNFSWETSLNAAWQKEEIVSLSNGKADDISNNWFIGQSIGVIYGYESNGLWKEEDAEEMAMFNANGHKFQAGMSRPVDQNGDYKIDPNNDRKIIGNTRPRWTVGLTNSFSYKNFELSCFIYGRIGYTYNTGGEWQGGRYVQRSINYYNENNKNSEYQKPIYNVAGGDPYFNILGYRSGSFLKIRDINLGYNLPASYAKKLGLESLKIYTQVRNIGLLYSEIDWLDMDLGGSTWNRGFVFGVNVGF